MTEPEGWNFGSGLFRKLYVKTGLKVNTNNNRQTRQHSKSLQISHPIRTLLNNNDASCIAPNYSKISNHGIKATLWANETAKTFWNNEAWREAAMTFKALYVIGNMTQAPNIPFQEEWHKPWSLCIICTSLFVWPLVLVFCVCVPDLGLGKFLTFYLLPHKQIHCFEQSRPSGCCVCYFSFPSRASLKQWALLLSYMNPSKC